MGRPEGIFFSFFRNWKKKEKKKVGRFFEGPSGYGKQNNFFNALHCFFFAHKAIIFMLRRGYPNMDHKSKLMHAFEDPVVLIPLTCYYSPNVSLDNLNIQKNETKDTPGLSTLPHWEGVSHLDTASPSLLPSI